MDRRSFGDRGFRPLGDDDFAELEKLGKVKFSCEVRASLNEALKRHCAPESDKLVYGESLAAAKMLAGLASDVARVLTTLNEMQDATRPGTRLAAWKLFPSDWMKLFGTTHLSGAALGQPYRRDATIQMLQTLCQWAGKEAKSLEPKSKKGRPANYWREVFFIIVAEAYTAAGGKVSANWQDAKGRREGPFLRVLRAINRRLPAGRRIEAETALDSRAATDIAVWGRWKNRPRKA